MQRDGDKYGGLSVYGTYNDLILTHDSLLTNLNGRREYFELVIIFNLADIHFQQILACDLALVEQLAVATKGG